MKLVADTKRLAQSGLRKLGINIQNPLAGLDALPEPEYDEVNRKENWAGPVVKDISTDVLSQIAIGKVSQKSLVPKLPPRSDGGRMINVTPQKANSIIDGVLNRTTPRPQVTDFTTGSLKPNSMFSPNYRPPNMMFMSQEPKVSTNEHIKRALLNDQNIILSPTYKGGQITRRDHADFFDVSAALIGGGQEDARDPSGKKIDYNRAKVTEFGGTKSEKRDAVYNHINSKIKGGISREEFNEYAKEQIEAEKDLRKAIKLLNVRSYASMKGIDLSEYPTKESQLELLSEINKAKKNKTGHLDYKETFDYGHIISAKTGFRLEDLGMNRISNTEIEAAHNIVSRDPYTQKIIEILQEGNRERGSRRDYHPTIQRMRNTAGSVVEDFIKWKANKGDDSVNLTKILEKFIPKDQHENYLQFIQKRFYEKRALGYATKKEFVEEVYGFPYKLYKDMPNKQKHEIDKAYVKQRSESGIVAGKQQYDQAGEWMLEAIDEFIGLHHFDKAKQLHNTKESTQLQDIHDFHTDTGAPLTIEDLLDMILPD